MALDTVVFSFPRDVVEPCVAGSGVAFSVNLKPSTTFARGDVLSYTAAAPTVYVPYATGATDGTGIPKAIMKYDVTTDSGGKITLGEPLVTWDSIAVWFGGYFDISQVNNLDATGIATNCGWHVVKGTLASGGVLKLA